MNREIIDFSGGEVELMDMLHENAMTGDVTKACASRCFKEVVPPLIRWIERERARGTEAHVICAAAQDIALSVTVTIVQNAGPPMDNAKVASVVEFLSGRLPEAFAQVAAHFRGQSSRRCRACGCTDSSACMTEDGPCSWAEPDLCSACAAKTPEPRP